MKPPFSLKVEYVLLIIAALTFAVTELCRQNANKKFSALDECFARVESAAYSKNFMGGANDEAFSRLTAALHPYLYFDEDFSQEFAALSVTLSRGGALGQDVLLRLSSFKNKIHAEQRKIAGGFDSLLFFPLLISVVAVAYIMYRQILQKAEQERMMAVNDAQVKLSRDLHDTVAQDLAAIKIYQKKGEAEKSAFYADRALMQTRYIIDALHIPLPAPLEKLISETLLAFENNTGTTDLPT